MLCQWEELEQRRPAVGTVVALGWRTGLGGGEGPMPWAAPPLPVPTPMQCCPFSRGGLSPSLRCLPPQDRVSSIYPEDLMQIVSHMDSLDNHRVSGPRPVAPLPALSAWHLHSMQGGCGPHLVPLECWAMSPDGCGTGPPSTCSKRP